jgi:endonuclease YncB( thermonuclease family)
MRRPGYNIMRGRSFVRMATFAALIPAQMPGAFAGHLARQVAVIDGRTLAIHGRPVRLWGIDAPEPDQLCRNAASERYRCGRKAAEELAAFLAHRAMDCVAVDRGRYQRRVAVCHVDRTDIAEWLVTNGLALETSNDGKGAYAAAQSDARRGQRGLWRGSFVAPWRYRRCRGSGGSMVGCSDQQDDAAF